MMMQGVVNIETFKIHCTIATSKVVVLRGIVKGYPLIPILEICAFRRYLMWII